MRAAIAVVGVVPSFPDTIADIVYTYFRSGCSYVSLPNPSPGLICRWNMAAINNNPFEYWITHDDPAYNKLMEDVSAFIQNPGDKDVPVHKVLHTGPSPFHFNQPKRCF